MNRIAISYDQINKKSISVLYNIKIIIKLEQIQLGMIEKKWKDNIK